MPVKIKINENISPKSYAIYFITCFFILLLVEDTFDGDFSWLWDILPVLTEPPWPLWPVSCPPPTSRCTKCSTTLIVSTQERPATPRYASKCHRHKKGKIYCLYLKKKEVRQKFPTLCHRFVVSLFLQTFNTSNVSAVCPDAECLFAFYGGETLYHKYLILFQFYNVFLFFWCANFVTALGQVTLSGAFASYYWAFKKPDDIPAFPIFSSLGRALRLAASFIFAYLRVQPFPLACVCDLLVLYSIYKSRVLFLMLMLGFCPDTTQAPWLLAPWSCPWSRSSGSFWSTWITSWKVRRFNFWIITLIIYLSETVLKGQFTPISKIPIFILTCDVIYQSDCFDVRCLV